MNPVNDGGRPGHESQSPSTNTLRIEDSRLVRTLITMMQNQSQSSAAEREPDPTSPPPPVGTPFGVMVKTSIRHLRLPQHAPRNNPTWLIELRDFGGGTPPVQIEVAGDTVLGVARPEQESPDLDLCPYHANGKGVSRRHALLRPSRNHLYIIDLQSTNGTHVNALPVGAGIARELHTNDAISLGALTFNLKILVTAADFEKARSKGRRGRR